jgi:hypothetical protein
MDEDMLDARTGHASRFEVIRQALEGVDLDALSAAILVDDRDDRNLELAIALLALNVGLPIVVSMFNENIAPHLQAANPALRILNPARIAAPVFVDARAVGQAASRAAGRRVRACRGLAHAQGGRARAGGHQPRSRSRQTRPPGYGGRVEQNQLWCRRRSAATAAATSPG